MGRTGLILTGALLAVIGAAAGTVVSYQRDLARAHEAARLGSLVVETQADPIEYGEKGAGIPLLSIHGAGGGFDQGLANAAELVGDGFRIVAPSRFGYLRTPMPPDTSPAAQADAHFALLSKLNVPRAIVVGVSAGAIGGRARASPSGKGRGAGARRSRLYSPTSPVTVEASRGNEFAFWAVNAGGDFAWWVAEKVAPSLLVRFLGVPPELMSTAPQAERDRVDAIMGSVEPLSQRFQGINIDSTPDLHELPLERIAAPVLIISARDDLFNTLPAAEFTASKIPGAVLVVYETGGHLLVGRWQDARERVRNFLDTAGLIQHGSDS